MKCEQTISVLNLYGVDGALIKTISDVNTGIQLPKESGLYFLNAQMESGEVVVVTVARL